jgi:hypothetical protein
MKSDEIKRMTKMKRRTILIACAFGLLLLPLKSQAIPITGGISFAGGYKAIDSTDHVTSNLTLADKLVFSPTSQYGTISPTTLEDATGSFSSLTLGSVVTLATPLDVNPALPPTDPIWSVGGFYLVLSSLTATVDTSNTLVLEGSGMLHYGNDTQGYDATPGNWVATFNSAHARFSWSSSSGANAVPDNANTLMLLGLSLAGVGIFGRFRRSWA